ncbi:hypothetical protein BXY66_0993 [Shimia isoporae]|uniref:Uncharacterized protein n=1 Tax=Shimia isoporae TaxID=647720 RepID=A0A4R1NV61_9RHOB|nr:hypothetical protein [Shimia isoporae]TCL08952.1 hypothetical protein BXY66_0993 [Shimia isoporae]
MRATLVLICLFLISCGRPLTETERAFMEDLAGETFEAKPVRITKNAPLGVATFQREARPRVACRERIFPPIKEEVVTTSPAGVVLWNQLYTSKDWSTANYMPSYPEKIHLNAAMYFAHEMVHVWQWQNREMTGYSPWKAAEEHQYSDDPYLFEVTDNASFLNYGYEQQASVVEEYLCCALLDPDAPRTSRLAELVAEVFPIENLPQPSEVILPWDEAETRGICR